MKEWLRKLVEEYFSSFNNKEEEGWSRKKILATLVVVLVIALQAKYVTGENVLEASIIDFGFVTTVLGIGAYQQRNKLIAKNPAMQPRTETKKSVEVAETTTEVT